VENKNNKRLFSLTRHDTQVCMPPAPGLHLPHAILRKIFH